jgi:hypothetical protein
LGAQAFTRRAARGRLGAASVRVHDSACGSITGRAAAAMAGTRKVINMRGTRARNL